MVRIVNPRKPPPQSTSSLLSFTSSPPPLHFINNNYYQSNDTKRNNPLRIVVIVVFLLAAAIIVTTKYRQIRTFMEYGDKDNAPLQVTASNEERPNGNTDSMVHGACPYRSLNDLTDTERYPKMASVNHYPTDRRRHMVLPPQDGNVTLVCCHTTVGPWNIMIHHHWAPMGAQRFLNMVQSQYFDTGVPFMRCMKDFLCQFGLNGQPNAMRPYHTLLQDDPNWLPSGPTYRIDPITQIRRFNRGYLAYAGAGPNSRDVQFIVALQDNGPLGGGSPWEVPWGELVGTHSYETLSKIYTGYDEKGPSQALLHKADALKIVKEQYPLIDYIQSCFVVDHFVDQR
jgi:peptidyl-prolyl cis-trans isomerase A (cyclophilin A)